MRRNNESIDKGPMAEAMKLLPFVRWDRYIDTEVELTVYGWIRRDDGKSDFVVLEYFPDFHDIKFTTSSSRLSAIIAKKLYGDTDGHTDCQRVEEGFRAYRIANVVRLRT